MNLFFKGQSTPHIVWQEVTLDVVGNTVRDVMTLVHFIRLSSYYLSIACLHSVFITSVMVVITAVIYSAQNPKPSRPSISRRLLASMVI
jgi:hypothetical protein